jgi:hypothetical protein
MVSKSQESEVNNMYEFGITHKQSNVTAIIYGYSFSDACRRAKKDPELWEIDYQEYVD